jgi:GNAT superfamily N-acetyltransferase
MEYQLPRDLKIRGMRREELEAVVDLANITSAPDIRYVLRNDLAVGKAGYALVAETEGDIVAAVTLTAEPLFPGTIGVRLAVKPGHRGHGIATAVADMVRGGLEVVADADTAVIPLRDDLPAGRSFAERYGFTLASHSVGFRYDLPSDEAGLARRADAAAARAAIVVRRTSVDSEEKVIADCFQRCLTGLPLPYGHRPADVLALLRSLPADARVLLAEPLASTGLAPVGLSLMVPQHDDNSWCTRATGTVPEYRGRGVATAVKAAGLLVARWAGASAVKTHNEAGNREIRSVNEALGMKPDVGYWALSLPLAVPGA